MRLFILVLFNSLLKVSLTDGISCLDDHGNPVDWFIGYKMPEGFEYVYITPGLSDWKKSEYTVNGEGMLKKTFEEMFRLNGTQSALYGMYNDEKPGVALDSYHYTWGHLKGAVAFDRSSGLWLIHSIPKLPHAMDHYQYPPTGRIYGQHMLCVTLHISDMLPLINQLIIARPLFLTRYVSPDLAEKHPEIVALFHNKQQKHVTNHTTSLATIKGLRLRHFSKAAEFGQDLYQDLVSPNLGYGLKVETWRHGESEPSVCRHGQPWVVNVEYLQFKKLNVSFNTFHDHAKWAATIPNALVDGNDQMWICLGDINRMYSQFRRGGGTMCIQNSTLWKAFSDLITKVEQCTPNCSEGNAGFCSEL